MRSVEQPGGMDPLAGLTPANLNATYDRLREQEPVHWSPWLRGWVLTRYADAIAVLADPTFVADDPISRLKRMERRGGPALENLTTVLSTVAFFTNPPHHTMLRRFIARVFQQLELIGLRASLAHRARELLATAREFGGLDLAADYASDLALFSVHRLLGLPLSDCVRLAAIAREVAWIFDVSPRSLRELRYAESRVGAMLEYLGPIIARHREDPDTKGISLLAALGERELGMSDREVAGLCTFLFSGGYETTATGIATAALMLLERHPLRARLTADPNQLAGAVRELLRLAAPFQYVTRVTGCDQCIGGVDIRRGDRVHIILGAANRDPAAFPNPDTIDPSRSGAESLAFGSGAYRCLGAGLAQLETEVAVAELLAFPELQLAADEAPVWETRTRVPALARARAVFAPTAGRRDQMLIVVHQMAKVASMAWVEAVRPIAGRVGSPPLHVHFLNESNIQAIQTILDVPRGRNNIVNPLVVRDIVRKARRSLAEIAAARQRGQPIHLLTGMRDPVTRSLSLLSFFADFCGHAGCRLSARDGACVNDVCSALSELWLAVLAGAEPEGSFERLVWRLIGAYRSWFDEELKSVFGLDLLAEPFPPDAGAQRLKGEGVELLAYRVEDMSPQAPAHAALREAAGQFLGTADFVLPQVNTAATRRSFPLYAEVRERFRLPQPMLAAIYDEPAVRHFYRPDEIARFKARWQCVD